MNIAKLRKLGRPITPRDLRNPKRKSGYDYVNNATPTQRGWSAGSAQKWRAAQGTKGVGTSAQDWRGPARRDPEEAARDFCNRFNGQEISAPMTLVTAGHEYEVDERDHDPEYEAALGVIRDRTAQRKGKQGYVYLIVEDRAGGGLEYGKIGFSTNPRKRVAELQTGNPRPLRLLYMKPGTEQDERDIHQRHIKLNVLQEWFRLTKEVIFEWGVEHRVDPPKASDEREAA